MKVCKFRDSVHFSDASLEKSQNDGLYIENPHQSQAPENQLSKSKKVHKNKYLRT